MTRSQHEKGDNAWRFSDVISPSSMTVDMERKPVLHLPDGRVLVKQIGYAPSVIVERKR